MTLGVNDFDPFIINVYLNPSRLDPGRRGKIHLNFYFHTSYWCLYLNLLRHNKEV